MKVTDSPISNPFASQRTVRGNTNRKFHVMFLAIVGFVLLIPIWIVKYPPLIDYPNHLARTFVLAHLHDSSYHFDSWYRANWGPYPYLVMDLLLIVFQKVVGVYAASKLVLSLAVLGVPLGIWLFTRRANPGQELLALWSLPIAYGTFFLMGSVNMRLSMAMMFAVLALWLRFLESKLSGLRAWQSLVLLALLTITYFTHVFGFVLAGLAMTVYGVLSRKRIRDLLLTWIAFLPGVAFYLYVKLDIPAPRMFIVRDFHQKLTGLTAILRGYSNPVDVFTYLMLLVAVLLGFWKNPEFRVNRAWLAVVVVLLVGYWFAPIVLGEAWDVDIRLLEFALAFSIAAANFGKRAKLVGLIALLVFTVRIANTIYNFHFEDRRVAALSSGNSVIPVGSRVLPVINSEGDRQFRKTYLHAWSYGVIDEGWRVPSLFQDRGVHTITNRLPVYNPVSFGSPRFDRPRQWDLVQRDYDYLWTYDTAFLYSDLDHIADAVLAVGKLRIYKLRPRTPSPAPPGD